MNLGIIKKNGIVINHRSLFKLIFNPILRLFKYQIVTIIEGDEIIKIKLNKCDRKICFSWKYDIIGCEIEKKRMII